MFKNLTNSVTGWLGAVKPDDDDTLTPNKSDDAVKNDKLGDGEAVKKKSTEESGGSTDTATPDESSKSEESEQKSADVQHQLDEMSAKAVTAAKEWGTWLYGVGKNATTEVVKSAKTLKSTVEEKTILGDFQKEQEKYITENKEKKAKSEAAVPPWVGYNEEEAMMKQIMTLSQDKRNFLRNPPSGVQFHFDYESMFPIALATLAEDKELEKMRFELVPKQVKEEVFWRNYFYRVSLIKQSAQLTTLAKQTGAAEKKDAASKSDSSADSGKSVSSAAQLSQQQAKVSVSSDQDDPDILPSTSPPDNEFVSDSFQADQINDEDLKKEMQMLGMRGDKDEDIPAWEAELAAELQDYEVVTDGQDDDEDGDDADLEREILKQIEAEAELEAGQ